MIPSLYHCMINTVTFTPDLTESHYECISCGLISREVEFGGIYYCPNPLCTVSGATCHKRHLLTVLNSQSSIRVNPAEVYDWGLDLIESVKDEKLLEAMRRSLEYWKNLVTNKHVLAYESSKTDNIKLVIDS